MIDFCHIVPTAHLEDFDSRSRSYLVLQHECENSPAYCSFFEKSPKYKILDNGAYEKGYPTPLPQLLHFADKIKAQEIVIPDVFQEAHYTLTHFTDFERYVMESPAIRKKFNFMAVPQGKTPEEYLKCLDVMLASPHVDTIGLSFIVIRDAFKAHTGFEDIMRNRLFITNLLSFANRKGKKFHLLGMGNPLELKYQVKHHWIRSADSSTCFVHGSNHIRFDKTLGLPEAHRVTKKLDFNTELQRVGIDWARIFDNMEVIDGFLRQYS